MNLKKYLPLEDHILTTKLSVAEVSKRLVENIDSTKTGIFFSFNNRTGKPFRGTVKEGSFKLTRIINYRNSFLPVITGGIYKQFGETQIKIKMRLHGLVAAFITVWLGIAIIICLAIIFTAISNKSKLLQNGFSATLLIPFAMLIFGWLIIYLAFKFESKKAIELFKKIGEAKMD